nr:hypothetical protein [Tanacetum cinerariifolium]
MSSCSPDRALLLGERLTADSGFSASCSLPSKASSPSLFYG